jgi:hypothetical protein
MKRMIVFVLFITLAFVSFAQFGSSLNSYDVEEIYGAQDADYGTLAITRLGAVEEIEKILIQTSLDRGRYIISISRVDTNLYKIIGKDIYIKIRRCYESAYNEEVILEITSSYSWNKGEIHFE